MDVSSVCVSGANPCWIISLLLKRGSKVPTTSSSSREAVNRKRELRVTTPLFFFLGLLHFFSGRCFVAAGCARAAAESSVLKTEAEGRSGI